MKARFKPVVVGISVLSGCGASGCNAEPSTKHLDASGLYLDASGPRLEIPASQARDREALLEVVTHYYPRWEPTQETLEQYVERYPSAPETQKRLELGKQALARQEWPRFFRDMRQALPGLFVHTGVPPWPQIPSYQVVACITHPPGTKRHKCMVFRMSYLAPVYDYHESDHKAPGKGTRITLTPSPAASAVVTIMERKIAEHFPDYVRLEPAVGETPLPDGIGLPVTLPGKGTLEQALFDEDRNW